MASPVTVSGFGSNMDINSVIQGLVKADSTRLQAITDKSSLLQSATSTLSDISSSLSALQTAADGLSSGGTVSTLKATTSSSAVVASASGGGAPSTFQVSVQALAKEQKTYSSRQSTSGALGQSGKISIAVGSNAAQSISVSANDSLDAIAGKINALGARVNASVFYDGTGYRLQIRGLDTGAANSLTFVENGTSLDLNGSGTTADAGTTVQTASDAALTVDGYQVTRSTNQITGVMPGVTLALSAETSSPVTVSLTSDADALATKVSTFATAYNKVISSIHTAAGYGTTKASNSALAADSALRTITDRLSSIVGRGNGSSTFPTLGDIGVSLTRDGTLTLDNTKLTQAIQKDPSAVSSLLARPTGANSGGVMADLEDAVKSLTDSSSGVLTNRLNTFKSQITDLGSQADREQSRLDSYEAQLRKQFTAMDTAMANNNTLLTTLNNAFNTNSSSSTSK